MIWGQMVHGGDEICEIERIGVKGQGFPAAEGTEDTEERTFFDRINKIHRISLEEVLFVGSVGRAFALEGFFSMRASSETFPASAVALACHIVRPTSDNIGSTWQTRKWEIYVI